MTFLLSKLARPEVSVVVEVGSYISGHIYQVHMNIRKKTHALSVVFGLETRTLSDCFHSDRSV